MRTIALPVLSSLLGLLRTRALLHLEVLALRRQLAMVNQTPRKRLRFHCGHPTAQWTAQQMIVAFPWDPAPQYLLRDRNKTYGASFRQRVHSLGMQEILTAPRSPWQNPYVERLIGSIRRECIDHIIVFNETHLKRTLRAYFSYYHKARTHLALDKQCPEPRPVEQPDLGTVIAFPHVGGLHHEYRRTA